MKKLTILLLIFSTVKVNAQMNHYYALGATEQVEDERGTTWEPLPCSIGATAYVVQNTVNKGGPQYRNLCYSGSLIAYNFFVNPGVYAIRLHFVEQNAAIQIGQRTFNIWINKDLVKSNFDIKKMCGYMSVCQIGSVVTDVNGRLIIELMYTKFNAVISGIEIIPMLPYMIQGCAFPLECKDILEAK